MPFSVALAGATGYAGGELLRLLLAHPQARIGALTAHSNVGDKLGMHHPHLRPLVDRVLRDTTAENLAGHDVVALALPHGASAPLAEQLSAIAPDTVIIDVGADHRLESAADWKQFYGGQHPGAWAYGLPEMLLGGDPPVKQRTKLAGASRIAVPGCNVTAVTLALVPGVDAGLIETTDLVAVLACGLSGAGKAPKPSLQAAEVLGAASPYAVGGVHRHIPEIEQNLRKAGASNVRLSFTPTLVPMTRGILATCSARLKGAPSLAQVKQAWCEAYEDEPFVHVLPDGVWPSTAMTLGANTALMQVTVDERAGRVVVVAAIDNLVKGAAGAAVQCLNLSLGLPETEGLTMIGVAP